MDFDEENFLKALKLMLDFYKVNQASLLKELLQRLNSAGKNSYYIGNSTNPFIPRDMRPNWKVFIDTLIFKIEGASGGRKSITPEE